MPATIYVLLLIYNSHVADNGNVTCLNQGKMHVHECMHAFLAALRKKCKFSVCSRPRSPILIAFQGALLNVTSVKRLIVFLSTMYTVRVAMFTPLKGPRAAKNG